MKLTLTLSNLRLAFEILLIIAVATATLLHFIPTRAAPAQAPKAPEALYWYQCNSPNHIGVFTDRVHIYCSSTSPVANAPALPVEVYWFAFPTSPDSAAASRFMSLLQTSVITSKPVWVEVNPTDTSGSSFGCGPDNCRRMYGMEMR